MKIIKLHMRGIKKFVYLIIPLVIIGVVLFYFNFGTPWSMFKHKDSFEMFLEEKYKKDFNISDISYDLFHNTYHAYAYEIDNPDLIFYVGENNGNREINDGYEFELTLAKAKVDLKDILEHHLPNYTKLGVELISLSDKELEVNIATNQGIDNTIKNLIKAKIEEKGYTAAQLYFHLDK